MQILRITMNNINEMVNYIEQLPKLKINNNYVSKICMNKHMDIELDKIYPIPKVKSSLSTEDILLIIDNNLKDYEIEIYF